MMLPMKKALPDSMNTGKSMVSKARKEKLRKGKKQETNHDLSIAHSVAWSQYRFNYPIEN
jgi:hypothetical protein